MTGLEKQKCVQKSNASAQATVDNGLEPDFQFAAMAGCSRPNSGPNELRIQRPKADIHTSKKLMQKLTLQPCWPAIQWQKAETNTSVISTSTNNSTSTRNTAEEHKI